MDLFEEVAKLRAARRLWARIMTERFGTADPRSQALRFHTQTGGATLTAQQPENNIVRTALEALAAVLGGTQSLHTNAFDEALACGRPALVELRVDPEALTPRATRAAKKPLTEPTRAWPIAERLHRTMEVA